MRASIQSRVGDVAGRGNDRIEQALKLIQDLTDPKPDIAIDPPWARAGQQGFEIGTSRIGLAEAGSGVTSRSAVRIGADPIRTRRPESPHQFHPAGPQGFAPHPLRFRPIRIGPSPIKPSPIRFRHQLQGTPGYALIVCAVMLLSWQIREVAPSIDGAWQTVSALLPASRNAGGAPISDLKSGVLDTTSSISTGRSPSALPLPTAYGVYAIGNAGLTQLEPLQMRVPDARIAISSIITKPSQAVLPDGSISFIAYQRELSSLAPDVASLRVVAKVARDLRFSDSGKPLVARAPEMWALRSKSINLAVTPIAGYREMVSIRAESPQMPVSPGRYMLVFNDQAYDFTVEGRATDRSHCLERSESLNGTVYNECSTPR